MIAPTSSPASEFYHSEARTYVFPEMGYSRSRDLGDILHREMRATSFIDEAITMLVFECGGVVEKRAEPFIFSAGLRRGGVVIKTELVYRDLEGKLQVGYMAVDGMDEPLPADQCTTLHPLATFSKVESEVLMDIHPLHQIGIDPQFLYRFGDTYAKRLK